MARYRVTQLSYIEGQLCEPGTVIEFAGKPGSNLEPVRGKKPDMADAKSIDVTSPELAQDMADKIPTRD